MLINQFVRFVYLIKLCIVNLSGGRLCWGATFRGIKLTRENVVSRSFVLQSYGFFYHSFSRLYALKNPFSYC
jgi:hypothetical protein